MYKFIKPYDNTPECNADLMTPEKISGNLKADSVTFYYPNQNDAAIQQVNLFIKKGSFVCRSRAVRDQEKVRSGNYFADWISQTADMCFSTTTNCMPWIQRF